MASKKFTKSSIVQLDKEWIEHIQGEDAHSSHRMFTSESYYKSMWESAGHAIMIIDSNGEILEANTYCLELLEATGAEVENSQMKDIIPDPLWKEEYANFKTVLNGQRYKSTSEIEINTINKKKKLVPVRMIVTRVPASLTRPFQHSIIHIYELQPLTNIESTYGGGPDYANMSWTQLLKSIVVNHIGKVIATIITIVLALLMSGNLMNVIDRIAPEQQRDRIEYIKPHYSDRSDSNKSQNQSEGQEHWRKHVE